MSSETTAVADNGLGAVMGSTNDLADEKPSSRIDRILAWVPRILSSKPHVMFLLLLGVYLIVLPLCGVHVSAGSELVGGNYTNVTSDIGACIAAGGTLHLIAQGRRSQKIEEERLRLTQETHQLLHHVHGDAARELGHLVADAGPGHSNPPVSELLSWAMHRLFPITPPPRS